MLKPTISIGFNSEEKTDTSHHAKWSIQRLSSSARIRVVWVHIFCLASLLLRSAYTQNIWTTPKLTCPKILKRSSYHYENTPIQIYRKFHLQKLTIFRLKKSDIFHISAQNIDCGYSLEPPRWGGSNEYQQSMFWAEIRKIMYTPVNPSFTIKKWGLRGSKLYRHVFVMLPLDTSKKSGWAASDLHLPSRHTTSKWRRTNVDATWSRRIDVDTTSF